MRPVNSLSLILYLWQNTSSAEENGSEHGYTANALNLQGTALPGTTLNLHLQFLVEIVPDLLKSWNIKIPLRCCQGSVT